MDNWRKDFKKMHRCFLHVEDNKLLESFIEKAIKQEKNRVLDELIKEIKGELYPKRFVDIRDVQAKEILELIKNKKDEMDSWKDEFYKQGEAMGIKINDLQRLRIIMKKATIEAKIEQVNRLIKFYEEDDGMEKGTLEMELFRLEQLKKGE